jgi:aspartate 1-decarboxylase
MFVEMCKSKIHRATITRTELHYDGSITIPRDLMDAAGIHANEKVQVLNVNNGIRFDTYVLEGKAGTGEIVLNGPAARLGEPDDLIIIISYCLVNEEELKKGFKTRIVHVDEHNAVKEVKG